MGNLCSKFGKDRSTNYVTFLSTDAGRTDGRTDGLRDFIVCPMHMHMHWTDNNETKGAFPAFSTPAVLMVLQIPNYTL